MRYCRTSLIFACLTFLALIHALAQETKLSDLPKSGHVDGNVYRNSYLGLNYYVPEQWSARVVGTKLLGVTNGYVLLTAKRTSGSDPLSTINVNVVDLTPYDGDLMRFLDARYRFKRDAVESEMTINGNRTTRLKGSDSSPEPVTFVNRTFYRLQGESTGVTRLTMATTEKGYAVVFELISPARYAPETSVQFMDSLHAVTFTTAEPSRAQN